MVGVQADRAARGFFGGDALFGRLDAVVHGVADEVRQRLAERIQDALVEIGGLPGQLQSNIFAAEFGDVAHDARKPPEKLLDRHHADLHHRLLEVVQNSRLKGEGITQSGAEGVFRKALVEFVNRAMEH